MTTHDIFHRLRVGLSLVVGFVLGKFLGEYFQHHASEFFIGGFLGGVILTHGFYRLIDILLGKDSSA